MERKDAIIAGAVAGLAVVAAGAAAAVNLGVVGLRADAAGSLGAAGEQIALTSDEVAALATDTTADVPDVETVYVDVYDRAGSPAGPGDAAVAGAARAGATPTTGAPTADDGSDAVGEREDEDHREHEEEPEGEADHHEDEEREYEGRDDDD